MQKYQFKFIELILFISTHSMKFLHNKKSKSYFSFYRTTTNFAVRYEDLNQADVKLTYDNLLNVAPICQFICQSTSRSPGSTVIV